MKKITFTLTLLFAFFAMNANFYTSGPDSICSVSIDTIQGGACLQANPSGTAPFTYIWSDSTTQMSTCITPGSGIYCVTMIDATGCVATACTGNIPSCSVWIYENNMLGAPLPLLESNVSGTAPFTYTWSTGENTANITPTVSGTYCVTISDANGCVSEDCEYVDLNTGGGNCTVQVDSSSNNCAMAFATGTAPFSYLWSNGQTTQEACINTAFDSLCVEVTDANGCVAYGCAIVGSFPYCEVYIASNGVDTLFAGANSNNPNVTFTYLWTTNETTQSISPSGSGNYCVTATGSDGCVTTACYNFIVSSDITGYVYLDSLSQGPNAVNNIKVYLIQFDNSDSSLTAVDSQTISSTPNMFIPTFTFSNLVAGDYLIKAALEPGSDDYATHLPTYYSQVLYWSNAITTSVPNAMNNPLHLHMITGSNPGGPGFIGGLVSEGANFTGGIFADTRGEGDPVANVNILLLTENDEPIAHTMTNADGEYEFPSVAYGTYKVIVEILGKDPGIKIVTLSPEDDSIVIDFEVNEGGTVKTDDLFLSNTLKVFPNPVGDLMTVQLEAVAEMDLQVSLFNMLGKNILSTQQHFNAGMQTIEISTASLQTGVYFLSLSDGVNVISKKIIKE